MGWPKPWRLESGWRCQQAGLLGAVREGGAMPPSPHLVEGRLLPVPLQKPSSLDTRLRLRPDFCLVSGHSHTGIGPTLRSSRSLHYLFKGPVSPEVLG